MTDTAPQTPGMVTAMIAAVAAFVAVPLLIPSAPVATGAAKTAITAAAIPAATTADVAASFSGAQKAEIEKIVRGYLIANPEIIVEVSRELEKRQASIQAESHSKLLVAKKDEVFHSPVDFVLGNPNGKITVVEYFDYNCGWCKKAVGEVSQLIKAEKDVRVVMKEFPIFGDDSKFAAKAAMASKLQGKYWEYHVAMMKERRVTKANALEIAKAVGLDVEKLKADMERPEFEAALKASSAMAQALGIEGTPGFIVDNRVNVGYLPATGLQELVSKVRQDGCKVC